MGAETSKEPEPGDLIEISRGFYQHWAVYIGDGYVVHLVGQNLGSSGASSTVSGDSAEGKIKKEKLQDVANGDSWCVNNLHDRKWKPRPQQEIVKEALSWVGKDVKYSLTDANCEHFATRCRYGKGQSLQVLKTAAIAGAAGTAVVAGTVATVGLPAVAIGAILLSGGGSCKCRSYRGAKSCGGMCSYRKLSRYRR
ncbi:hypothetical protein PAMA_017699 [Pampus argenteus]